LLESLSRLEASPAQIVIGIEATSRYHENLYEELKRRGYQMRGVRIPGKRIIFTSNKGYEPRPIGLML